MREMGSILESFGGKQLSSLSVDERLSLIDVLWESICEENAVPIPEAHARELNKRWKMIEEGKMTSRPWEEVRKDIFGGDEA